MTEYLATGGPSPAELTELRLCRDVYHCLPSQLRAEDLGTILAHLTVMRVEAEVHERLRGT